MRRAWCWSQANGRVGQMGALADVIEVEPRYERAVEACLGDLLQHVLVRRHEHAAAGLALVREKDAGRCGFVVVGATACVPRCARVRRVRAGAESTSCTAPCCCRASCASPASTKRPFARPSARRSSSSRSSRRASWRPICRIAGRDARRRRAARRASGRRRRQGRIARHSGDQARDQGAARARGGRARRARAARRRDGAVRADDRARDRRHRRAVRRAASPGEGRSSRSKRSCSARGGRDAPRAAPRAGRGETQARPRRDCRARCPADRSARVDRAARRRASARRGGCWRDAQRTLTAAREHSDALAQRAAEARATHAALVERSAGVAADVRRLEDAARELERRVETCATRPHADARSARAAARGRGRRPAR